MCGTISEYENGLGYYCLDRARRAHVPVVGRVARTKNGCRCCSRYFYLVIQFVGAQKNILLHPRMCSAGWLSDDSSCPLYVVVLRTNRVPTGFWVVILRGASHSETISLRTRSTTTFNIVRSTSPRHTHFWSKSGPHVLKKLRPPITTFSTHSIHLINGRISFHSWQILSPSKTGFIASAHRSPNITLLTLIATTL